MSGLRQVALFMLLLSLGTAAWTRALPEAQGAAPPPAVEISLVPDQQDIVTDAGAEAARNGRLLFSGGTAQRQAADLQFELPSAPDQRWVLWMSRDPIGLVRVTGLDGSIQSSGFYTPSVDEGLIPVGYAFALPRGAAGQQRLRLDLQGAVRSAPTPRILSEQQALRLASREFALASAIYAALVTLLIASLVLYPAVRDRMFLLYSAYLAMALLFVATVSGHLPALPGGAILGGMGARGFWLIVLAFNAVALLALTRFAETHASRLAWVRHLDRLVIAMAVLVLVPLLPLDAVTNSLQGITTAAWLLAMAGSIVATVDGVRRGVQMAVAATVSLLLLLVAAVAYEAMQRAWIDDTILTRHGYQFVLVLVSVIMFVGLSSRIGQVRQRLDEETRARILSESRLRQERIRIDFAQALQVGLRGVAEADVAPVAFRLLCEHARQLAGVESAVVVGSGYLGHEELLVKPDGQAARFAHEVRLARNVVCEKSYNPEPVQVRFDGAHETGIDEKPLRAIIPIRLTAPAWAAMVLPANVAQPFEQATLSALMGLARVAVLHADQTYAATQLRRTAEHDSLTGTQNRRSLDKAIAQEFKAHGAHEVALSVLFIDIDLFKRINDSLGHACGDLCIRSIAASLRNALRPTDAIGRYGGDEFLVLLPGRDGAAARIIAERLRKAVEGSQVHWQGAALPMTVSIGMATRREADHVPATLLERADKALYAAKHEGRNRVCVAPAVFS